MDAALMMRWDHLLRLRSITLGGLEQGRAAGVLKASREALAKIRAKGAELPSLLKAYEQSLPMILGVSAVELLDNPLMNDLSVEVEKAPGKKCERCWIFKTDLGVKTQWPDICGRCADAIEMEEVKR